MKRILIFTFVGPILGVLLFFVPAFISAYIFSDEGHRLPLESLMVFPFFFIFAYVVAVVPAFLIGAVAKLLTFKNPWLNFTSLVLASIIICVVCFYELRTDWFSIMVGMGVASTVIVGYLMLLKGKVYSIKKSNEKLK